MKIKSIRVAYREKKPKGRWVRCEWGHSVKHAKALIACEQLQIIIEGVVVRALGGFYANEVCDSGVRRD